MNRPIRAGPLLSPLNIRSYCLTVMRPGLRLAVLLTSAFLLLIGAPTPAAAQGGAADLILEGEVWTGTEARPRAEAVAVEGNRILAVGSRAAVRKHEGAETRTIRVEDGLITPGIIDNHTHFNRAGALLLGINLLDVNDPDTLAERVRAARERLPDGSWIVGGDWGAYAQWEQGGDTDAGGEPVLEPHRDPIDEVTPETPVLLSRFDGEQYLANEHALNEAGLTCADAGVDCEDGRPTGRLTPVAAERVREARPEKSWARRMAETDTALTRLRRHGITEIHDITTPTQMRLFQAFKEEGRLTTRVYARPTIDKWSGLDAVGIEHGYGDSMLRIGGLKGFVDGILGNSSARFYEPYEHKDSRGQWRDHMEEGMQAYIDGAARSGHWPQVHAIGTQAIDTLLTMYDRAQAAVEGTESQRWRVIHAQHLRGPEVADRMARLDVIAEMQPVHLIDDMRWVERRVGKERARWSWAHKTIHESGVRLSFGSDWPGTNAAWYTTDPLHGIYAAAERKTVHGKPEGGWIPEERISRELALRAYTVNNAYAAGMEEEKGRIRPGMLADFTVFSADVTKAETDLLETEVLYTIVDGEIVYQSERADE